MPQRDRIKGAIRLTNFESGSLARLDFVNDAIIDVFQCGRHDAREPVAILADQIDACFDSSLLSCGQQPSGLRAELWIALIERIQQQQITKMKEGSFNLGEVEIVSLPKSIRAAIMKKRPPAISLFGHHIGVRSVGFGSFSEQTSVNLVLTAIVENEFAQGILADQPGPQEWEIGAQLREVQENIVWGSAGALGLAADIGKLLPLRKDIDQLDLIDDPITARQNTAPARMLSFHDAK